MTVIAPKAGELRQVIAFQTRTLPTNTDGDPSAAATWSTTFSRRASIQPLYGRKLVNAREIAAEVTHEIIIRASASQVITPGMRAVFKSRIFDINAVLNQGEQTVYLQILAKEAV